MAETMFTRVPRADMPAALQSNYDMALAQVGEGGTVEVFAQRPDLYRFYATDFYALVWDETRMEVDNRTKELLRLKLSKENGCLVCNGFNVPSALAAGYTSAQIEHIYDPTPEHFSERELAVLALASEFEIANGQFELSPALFDRLRAHFSEPQILELAFLATFLSAWARLTIGFGLVSRDPTCPMPQPSAATGI